MWKIAMVRQLSNGLLSAALCATALLMMASVGQAQSPSEVTVDYVLVVDKSGSMRGLPAGSGNADIFADVQENLTNFVGELEPGPSIFVVPFAGGVQAMKRFDIESEADLNEVQSYVQGLEADGTNTHVYQSVLDAFEAYNEFRQSEAGQSKGRRVGVLQVYTDGQDNGPKNYAMNDVLNRFKNMRQKSDWLYYSTLGVDLSEEAREDIASSDVATYNPQPSETIAPTRVVELGPPSLLDLGNVMSTPTPERAMRFTVHSQKGLPEGFRLATETRFETVEQQGAFVEITEPKSVDPTKPVTLKFEVQNKGSLSTGRYEGAIHFDSPEPSIIVAPNAIETHFRFQKKRTVGVRPPRGSDELRATLSADPFRSDSGAAQDAITFPLKRNAEARKRGGAVRVRIEQDADSPAPLPSEAFRVNGKPGTQHTFQADQASDLTVGASATEKTAPGQYRGTIQVTSSAVAVDSAAASIPWSLEVPEPPRSAASWLLLIGGLLLLGLLAHRFVTSIWIWTQLSPDTLSGRLTVTEPQSEGYREIPLGSREHLQLGSGGEEFPDAEARVMLTPDRNGQSVHTKARLEEGGATIREPGGMQYRSFASETLRDGYHLKVPPYELEYRNP